MYGFITRYLASVYLDYSSLKPERSLIRKLEDAIDDESFVSLNIVELPGPGVAPIPRIGFSASDAGLNLALLGKRFNFTFQPTSLKNKNIIGLSDFAKKAGDILSSLMKCLNRNVFRIALVREGLLPEMDDEKIEIIHRSLMKIPASLLVDNPFEWTYKVATRIEREFGDCRELTNILITVVRSDFKLEFPGGSEEKYNGIRLDLDINTIPDNPLERFGPDQVKSFFQKVIGWHTDLEKDFMGFLKEGGYVE